MEENKCYFPSDIIIEKEFLTGFGKKELRRTLTGSFIGLITALIIYLFKGIFILAMVTFLTFSVGGGFLCIREKGMNLSFLDHVINLVHYIKCQKIFIFEYLDEWR